MILPFIRNRQMQYQTRWMYYVECHNTVFGSKRFAVCAQAVYFLHSTMPSAMCLWLIDASIICRVTYFQFPIQSAFFHLHQPIDISARHRPHSGVRGLPNIGHRTLLKIWIGAFLVRSLHFMGMSFNSFQR